MPESKLQPPLAACVFCGGRFSDTPLATIQESPDVSLLRCSRCGACSASRMPREDALAEYYAGYFRSFGHAAKVTHDSPERFARHIASFVRDHKEKVTISDFGGGDGSLSLELAKILCAGGCSCAEITVIDYERAVASARDARIAIRSQRPGAPVPSSDVIVASAVLEHIPAPMDSLCQLLGAQSPGGILYVRTPAVAGFMRLAEMFGTRLDFTFPAHLHDLGQEFWEKVLDVVPGGNGFEIVRSAPSLVETDFGRHPWHTAAAYLAKAPWRVFGSRYRFVGGWEVVIRRRAGLSG